MKKKISLISQEMIMRYSDRYQSMGICVKTLGWGSVEQQQYRFAQSLRSQLSFKNKIILDIGCGFGDYYEFLVKEGVHAKEYIGWDINEDLLREAKLKYCDNDIVRFDLVDLSAEKKKATVADIGIMLGVLNLNLKGTFNNYNYSKLFIKNAFNKVRELLVVDFLSSQLTSTYPKEDFVFYHDPAKVLKMALNFTDNVELKHNYLPIPQKEFMLFLYK